MNHEQNYELPLDHLDRGLRDVVECPNVRVRAVTLRLLQLDLYITNIEMDEFRCEMIQYENRMLDKIAQKLEIVFIITAFETCPCNVNPFSM